MPTLSPILGLSILASGEKPGSWHDDVNNNMVKLEQAVASSGPGRPASIPDRAGLRYFQQASVHVWWTSTPEGAGFVWKRDIPSGLIISFAGGLAPPLGWALCDGSQVSPEEGVVINLPDLRGRFVIGNDEADPDFVFNNTGGVKESSLTLANLPTDVLSTEEETVVIQTPLWFTDAQATIDIGLRSQAFKLREDNIQQFIRPHSHSFKLNNTEVQTPVSKLPPYYSLVYLYKL